ncbi:MAG TPA: ACP phosphodiesterase [Saprospiraceae bacterium]|nr:ACP phosphodiesterase [Saprospiraceae bacterium]
MNHLAHCFLSFSDEDLLVGNFIGDFVKGSAWKNYPEGIQHGILLHRTIDAYTDEHPAARQSKERIRSFAGRYASAVTDILYDYILAMRWSEYTAESFDDFATKTYEQLEKRAAEMPPELRERLPRMLAGHFLHGYARRDSLEWVLDRFSRRMVGGLDAAGLATFFSAEIESFSADFKFFFPDLLTAAKQRLKELQ